jgi:cystathionine beta-lyase
MLSSKPSRLSGSTAGKLTGMEEFQLMREPGFETLCAHAGEDPARFQGAVVPPIFQNSLFVSPDCETFVRRDQDPNLYDYTRVANPTTDVLETKLAALEKAEAARCFGSGDAAVTAAVLHSVKAGDHIVAVETAYGPTRSILGSYLRKFDVATTFVAGNDPQQWVDACQPNTRLFYLESPSSLVFNLQDIRAVTGFAKERGITTITDNSWASPYFQNPIELGVDLVLHSATKYLGGHSDIVAGVVTGNKERMQSIKQQEGALLGGILDPFAAWLMLRGLRTLALRMERHQSSAMAIASYLEQHPRVAHVYYPGLSSHSQYSLGRRQLRGYSGLLSFELKDGDEGAAFRFVNALRYFGIGVSWGGFESLAIPIGFPEKSRGGAAALPGVHGAIGRINWGARLHIGLETQEDLLEDLELALRD